MHPTYIHPPKCWHDVSNTNIYIQLTYIPQIVGSIYPIQIYISINIHFPSLCPKGTKKPSNLHLSPNCWHGISNINIYFQLSHAHNIVGSIYPIQMCIFVSVHECVRHTSELYCSHVTNIGVTLSPLG